MKKNSKKRSTIYKYPDFRMLMKFHNVELQKNRCEHQIKLRSPMTAFDRTYRVLSECVNFVATVSNMSGRNTLYANFVTEFQ